MRKENDILGDNSDESLDNNDVADIDNNNKKNGLSKSTIGIIVVIVAAVLVIGLIIFFVVKSNKKADSAANDSSSSLTVDLMEKVPYTESNVVSVNGEEISLKLYAYYFNSYKSQYDNGDDNYWTKDKAELVSTIKTQVETELKYLKMPYVLADELGIKWDADDDKALETEFEDIYKQYGSEDAVNKILDEMNTDMDAFKQVVKSSVLGKKVFDYLYGDNGTQKISDAELLAYYNKNDALVKHILIQFPEKTNSKTGETMTDDAYSSAVKELKKTADEVLARAKSGEDFDSLIAKFNDDPGMIENKQGYFFDENGSYYEEFKTASLALPVNGISDIVETEAGYHIIKRMPIEDYFNTNKDSLVTQYYQLVYSEKSTATLDKIKIENGKDYDKINAFSFDK